METSSPDRIVPQVRISHFPASRRDICGCCCRKRSRSGYFIECKKVEMKSGSWRKLYLTCTAVRGVAEGYKSLAIRPDPSGYSSTLEEGDCRYRRQMCRRH